MHDHKQSGFTVIENIVCSDISLSHRYSSLIPEMTMHTSFVYPSSWVDSQDEALLSKNGVEVLDLPREIVELRGEKVRDVWVPSASGEGGERAISYHFIRMPTQGQRCFMSLILVIWPRRVLSIASGGRMLGLTWVQDIGVVHVQVAPLDRSRSWSGRRVRH